VNKKYQSNLEKSRVATPSNTPIFRPTPLTTPNGIRIQSAVLPQYTFRTHTQTDDGPAGEKPIPIPAYAVTDIATRLRTTSAAQSRPNVRRVRRYGTSPRQRMHSPTACASCTICTMLPTIFCTVIKSLLQVVPKCVPQIQYRPIWWTAAVVKTCMKTLSNRLSNFDGLYVV